MQTIDTADLYSNLPKSKEYNIIRAEQCKTESLRSVKKAILMSFTLEQCAPGLLPLRDCAAFGNGSLDISSPHILLGYRNQENNSFNEEKEFSLS